MKLNWVIARCWTKSNKFTLTEAASRIQQRQPVWLKVRWTERMSARRKDANCRSKGGEMSLCFVFVVFFHTCIFSLGIFFISTWMKASRFIRFDYFHLRSEKRLYLISSQITFICACTRKIWYSFVWKILPKIVQL